MKQPATKDSIQRVLSALLMNDYHSAIESTAEKLTRVEEDRASDRDIILVIVNLLFNAHYPQADLCRSVLDVFDIESGPSLMHYFRSKDTFAATVFQYNLQVVREKWEKNTL
jgi:hypothetical protein